MSVSYFDFFEKKREFSYQYTDAVWIEQILKAKGMAWRRTSISEVFAWWPHRTLGYTSKRYLDTKERRRLDQIVVNAVAAHAHKQSSNDGTCELYSEITVQISKKLKKKKISTRSSRGPLGGSLIGSGGIKVKFNSSTKEALIEGQGSWTKNHAPRKLCNMGSCFNLNQTACRRLSSPHSEGSKERAAEPLPVFWYPGPNPANPNPCALVQCAWLHPGLRTWGKSGDSISQRNEEEEGEEVVLVTNPQDACVFVVDPGSAFPASGGVYPPCGSFIWSELKHWNAAGRPGRNHVLIMPSCLSGCDSVGTDQCYGPIGDAIVVTSNEWRGYFRPNFDFMLPQGASTALGNLVRANPAPFESGGGPVDRGFDRQVLISFRGTTLGITTSWFAHRAIAAVASNNPKRGVVIDVKQKDTSNDLKPCERYASGATWLDYIELARNSTFGFSPGGGGPYSFRFFEVLAAGAIPVVTEDLVLPWSDGGPGALPSPPMLRRKKGEGALPSPAFESPRRNGSAANAGWSSGAEARLPPWDACVVRVSESELFALREVLEAIAPPGSRALALRQAACRVLYDELFLGYSLLGGAPGTHAHGMAKSLATKDGDVQWFLSQMLYRRFWGELRARIKKAGEVGPSGFGAGA
eukprot:CAMPEP_0172585690 /NCGR_PEP_ID=MMETSP1068-20121228/5085_1 /TAXON_ID=35684 /ORGANISM="Pseudopedinella elastica, Strain CCMP716" /LENGTH=636 /DNA_ID=CAMNT_0013380239 /DNA_START=178 /DNA_END=2088 /DNA_ORIENTATION=-